MTGFLIGGLFDLSGEGWPDGAGDSFSRAFLPGKAGHVSAGRVRGGYLCERPFGAPSGRRPARVKSAEWTPRADGSHILLAGDLFDIDELRARFSLSPTSDQASLYGELYDRLGDDCDSRIAGDYAVIQWFPQNRRLRLARSPVSGFPLHVWREGSRLAAASIPRPLFAVGASTEVDDDTVVDRLLFNFRSEERTWYRALRSSPCGTVTWHDASGQRARRYWSVAAVPAISLPRDDDYVEAVDHLFGKAVDAALAGHERPALFLSGGLDSQGLASYVVERLRPDQRLRTYTSVPARLPDVPPHRFADESDQVRALAKLYPQIEAEFMDCPDGGILDGMAEQMALGNWPVHNQFAAYWGHEGLRRAAGAGCDVILSAGFGNPTFSYDGHTLYPHLLRTGQWGRLMREARLGRDHRPAWRYGAAMSLRPFFPRAFRIALDRLRGNETALFGGWCPLDWRFVRSSGGLKRAIAIGADPMAGAVRSAREWREIVIGYSTVESPEMQTAAMLQYGIRDRDPLKYQPLLDFCMGVPDDQYLRNGQNRWLARRLLEGRVPEAVRTERRTGWQGADLRWRFERDKPRLRADLVSFAKDPRIARLFDFDRLIAALDAWDGPDGPATLQGSDMQAAVSRAVAHAHFIRMAEGRNVG